MNSWLNNQKQVLSQQIIAGRLPHAILIVGPKGAGKQQLAHWLIELLICQAPIPENSCLNEPGNNGPLSACGQCKTCLLRQSKTYPDHIELETEKNTIGVDNIRLVSQFFEKTAQIGRVKTACIPQAEIMTTAAANALLKTLEEPTANSFIILTCVKAEQLLPTIVSRCRQIEIRPPVGEKLLTAQHSAFNQEYYLESSGESREQRGNAFTNVSQLPELSDENLYQHFNQFKASFKSYLNAKTSRAELLTELEQQVEAYRWIEQILVDLLRAKKHWLEQTEAIDLSQHSILAIYQLVLSFNKTRADLPQVNSRFMLEKLLIDIDMIRINDSHKVS